MIKKEKRAPDAQFLAQLEGYSLTTAEIIYRMPDAQTLLQSYVWQDYDMAPRFPKLGKFLEFWETFAQAIRCIIRGHIRRARRPHVNTRHHRSCHFCGSKMTKRLFSATRETPIQATLHFDRFGNLTSTKQL